MLTALFTFGFPLIGVIGSLIIGVYVPAPLKRLCIEAVIMISIASILYGKGRSHAERACEYTRAAAVREAEARVRVKMEGDLALLKRSIDELRRRETESNEELTKLRDEINREPPEKADVPPVPPIILKAIRGK